MNRQQLVDVIKGLLVAGGPFAVILVNLLGMEQGAAERIVQGLAALASIGGIVWLAIGRTDANMVVDAASVKGVQVHANPDTAPAAVVKLAEDTKVADVFPMEGGPRVPPKDEDAHQGPAPASAPTYRT
jgi:hypothetical protein